MHKARRLHLRVNSLAIYSKVRMAEEEGFEPPCESPRKRFSRPPVSTTHPFLRSLLGNSILAIASFRQKAVEPRLDLREVPHHLAVRHIFLRRQLSLNIKGPSRLERARLHLGQSLEALA